MEYRAVTRVTYSHNGERIVALPGQIVELPDDQAAALMAMTPKAAIEVIEALAPVRAAPAASASRTPATRAPRTRRASNPEDGL